MVFGVELRKLKEKASFFINRKRELAELEDSGRHAVLVGYRRMGKTHLIVKHLALKSNRKTVPVYMDMLYFSSWAEFADSLIDRFLMAYDEATQDKLSPLFKRISGSLFSAFSSVSEIEAKLGDSGAQFFSIKLGFHENKKNEFDLLRGAIDFVSEFAQKKNITAIIVLDEIQNIKSYGKVKQGLAIIRGQLQFTKNIRLIISGSLPSFIYLNILEKSKPFWKQLKAMEIVPFELSAVEEATKKFGVPVKSAVEILRITRGVPDYVVKVLGKVKQGASPQSAFDAIVAEEALFFSSLISSLSKAEHVAINCIALGGSYSKIEETLRYPPTAVLKSLVAKGAVAKTARGKYQIVDPGLESYLKH